MTVKTGKDILQNCWHQIKLLDST